MVPHLIERAKSNRAACRGCGGRIAKDELRLGVAHAQENGGHSYQWLHLACAATQRHLELEQALADTSLPIPDRAALEQQIAATKHSAPVLPTPRAVSGAGLDTFHCIACGSWSFPMSLRILVPTQITVGDQVLTREAPLDPRCANRYLGEPNLLATLLQNSPGLPADDVAWLRTCVT